MQRNLFRAAFCAAMLAGGALAACSDAPTSPADADDPRIEQLVAMGFDRAKIVDRGDHFQVEGDIRIDKRDLQRATGGAARPGGPSSQRIVSAISRNRMNIRVNLAAVDVESAAWAAATRAAMANWSTAMNTGITFVEGGPADVTVSFVNSIDGCTVAAAAYPVNWVPGATVIISRQFMTSYTAAQQTWIMTHELGHTIGLGHTDVNFGTLISGTPVTDGGSVMNSGGWFGPGCPPSAPAWGGFSGFDLLAASQLYPLPSVSGALATDAGGDVRLTWNAYPGATSYSVQRVEQRTQDDFYANTVSTTVTEEGWISGITGNSYDTGRPFTGSSTCVWSMTWQTSDVSTYLYQIIAHTPRGDTPTYTSIYTNDATC